MTYSISSYNFVHGTNDILVSKTSKKKAIEYAKTSASLGAKNVKVINDMTKEIIASFN